MAHYPAAGETRVGVAGGLAAGGRPVDLVVEEPGEVTRCVETDLGWGEEPLHWPEAYGFKRSQAPVAAPVALLDCAICGSESSASAM